MIQETRIRPLNAAPVRRGVYVLYWMQQSQRTVCNHALDYAIDRANDLGLPVVVGFGLTDSYPNANLRHYAFMLEGLRQCGGDLHKLGIRFVLRLGAPDDVALELARDAALLVADVGYLRHQRAWRARVGREAPCAALAVESDVVVPVEAASGKEEYAARTFRPKIAGLLSDYLVPLRARRVRRDSLGLEIPREEEWDGLLDRLRIDRSVGSVAGVAGGTAEAERRLEDFLNRRFARYAEARNDPAEDGQSGLSPYLHFGQISPLQVALAVAERAPGGEEASAEAFLEELIVRRELSVNFVYHNPGYDRYESLPEWARKTLEKHARDRRSPVYTRGTLVAARTDDPYWNAAMNEMRRTGRMHGYMRMYWGKKILEWSADPRGAFQTALALNNKYFLDGRDPSSYGNVAWLFGKHDRPWQERPVFGTVRYMNAQGLRRKFDMEAYLRRFGG